MFTGESSQGGRMRFDLVLWYGESNIQEKNNLHLVSIWSKCGRYCLFLRWANVEFSSLPSLREEMSGAAGSSHPVTWAQEQEPGCPCCSSPGRQSLLCTGSQTTASKAGFLFTNHTLCSKRSHTRLSSRFHVNSFCVWSLQVCSTLHTTFISCYPFREVLE